MTRRVVPDEVEEISTAISELADDAQVVLTTGGTGVGPRDVTPEATRIVLERWALGHRRGHPRGRRREDAARHAFARRRRHSRQDARRQPAGLARRLPGRVRRAPAGARARRAAARRRGDGAPADVMESAVVYPRRFASLVKLEHTVFALPFAYVGAFLALDRGAERRADPLGDAGHGRRALVRDGGEPPRRRRHRRAQPAHGGPRAAAAGRLRPGRSLLLLRRLARRLPARRLQPRPGRPLAVADSGGDVRRLPVPQARDVAEPRLARRNARARAGRRLGGDDR